MLGIVEWYNDLMENKSDPRTKDWFLISSPVTVIMILIIYLYFCAYAGPKYMKNRKPYELRTLIIVYNFLQTLISIYIVREGVMTGYIGEFNYFCEPVDYTDSPKNRRIFNIVYLYFICKLVELLDTVFFVLRKKNRQISTLHLFHHTLMPLVTMVGLRFAPNGHGTLFGFINSFVHIIMYAYYMLSSMGPHMNKYLWWKRHLTTLQLVQFTIVFFHSVQVFFNGCNYPKPIAFLLTACSLMFMYMFGSFYVETYITSAKQRSTKEGKNATTKNSSDAIADKVK